MNIQEARRFGVRKNSMLADLGLLLVALIWGMGFSATQYAIDAGLSAALILLLRFSVAALAMAALCFPQVRGVSAKEFLTGSVSGLFLFLAFCFQIEAQSRTTPSNCAFITTTNVLMVPFIVWAASRRRPGVKNIVLPALTVAGIFILGYAPGQGIAFTRGDLLALACAFLFACHIASLEFTSQRVEARRLTFIQMATAALLSLLYYLIADRSAVSAQMLRQGALPVLYLGLFSTCACFFLQTACQRYTSATKAAIFLSLEGVFGSLFSVLLGLEPLKWTLLVGGGIISLSVVLTEVGLPRRRKNA